jgi:hypothetical protein
MREASLFGGEMQGLYIIQTTEFIRFDESIYKIGKSARNILKRCETGYPKYSKIMYLLYCPPEVVLTIETEVKAVLSSHARVKPCRDLGTEFFEANLNVIKAVMLGVFIKYMTMIYNNNELPNTEMKGLMPPCDDDEMVDIQHDNNNESCIYTLVKNQIDEDYLINIAITTNPELINRVRFSPDAKSTSESGLFYCDPATNIWRQRHSVVIEELIAVTFRNMQSIGQTEKHHVLSKKGRGDMLHLLKGKVVDEIFRTTLDQNPNIFALENGCFSFASDGTNPEFRTSHPEDLFSINTKWSYSKEQAVLARPQLEEFLSKVLPDPHERRLTLAYFASLMSGAAANTANTKILVLYDSRSGNSGKSTLMALVEMFFGEYAEAKKGTRFVCKGSIDRDSNDKWLEPFKAKKLIVARELKDYMTLDTTMLKKGIGAGIVLIFREHDFPKIDQGDNAFLDRLIFVPTRSKFVQNVHLYGEEHPWTYEADIGVSLRFTGWLSALADIFVEHSGIMSGFETVPQSMTSWQDDNGSVKAFIDAHVIASPGSWFTLSDARKQLAEYMSSFAGTASFAITVTTFKTVLARTLDTQCHSQKWLDGGNRRNAFVGFALLPKPSAKSVESN